MTIHKLLRAYRRYRYVGRPRPHVTNHPVTCVCRRTAADPWFWNQDTTLLPAYVRRVP